MELTSVTKKIKFSVLMSVYKKDNPFFFREALYSVIHQTYSADEIILVKDGAVSKEIQLVIDDVKKQCKYLYVYELKENVGLGKALSYGMQKCRNEIIARMDSDDISLPERFEKEIAYFGKNKNLTIVGSYIDEFVENPNKPKSIRTVPTSMEEIKRKVVVRCPFNHPSVMFKKSHILAAGGYQSLYLFEDYYLWIRLIEKEFICANIPEVLVHMRIGNGMVSRRGGKEYFESYKFLQNYMLKHKMLPIWKYMFNLIVRWSVQVGMSDRMREVVYRRILR
ncbi:MAG: glycosyltransferase [Lachnospiraceae bacterium]|nr:glycosyltransferase [Lachnospiraceae bacterium]